MPIQKRFGAATKSKSCTCGQCKALVPAGADRWFDNTVFPRKPICHGCYLLAVDTPAPDLTALLTFLEQTMPALITRAVVDAIHLSKLQISDTELERLETTVYSIPGTEEEISDDFI